MLGSRRKRKDKVGSSKYILLLNAPMGKVGCEKNRGGEEGMKKRGARTHFESSEFSDPFTAVLVNYGVFTASLNVSWTL